MWRLPEKAAAQNPSCQLKYWSRQSGERNNTNVTPYTLRVRALSNSKNHRKEIWERRDHSGGKLSLKRRIR